MILRANRPKLENVVAALVLAVNKCIIRRAEKAKERDHVDHSSLLLMQYIPIWTYSSCS